MNKHFYRRFGMTTSPNLSVLRLCGETTTGTDTTSETERPQLINRLKSKTLLLWKVATQNKCLCHLSENDVSFCLTDLKEVSWMWGANYSFDERPLIWHDTFYLLLFTPSRPVSWQSGSICSVTLGCRERWKDRHREERRKNGQRDGRTVNVPFVTER